jgi:deferrochelatase/peroxidase EfeB
MFHLIAALRSVAAHDSGVARARTLSESDTQTHRLLRRGIPYGPPSESTLRDPVKDDVDRGLLFMAYMTSISDQFEFIMRHMLNNPGFKKPETGVDPILGEANSERSSISTVLPEEQKPVELELGKWVTATGGGYFFAPSLSGLRYIAT